MRHKRIIKNTRPRDRKPQHVENLPEELLDLAARTEGVLGTDQGNVKHDIALIDVATPHAKAPDDPDPPEATAAEIHHRPECEIHN